MAKQYYYFVSGLPSLSIDDQKNVLTDKQFLLDAREHLSPGDFELLLLASLPTDADDLLKASYEPDPELESNPDKDCSLWFWQRYVSNAREKLLNPRLKLPKDYQYLPDGIHEFCRQTLSAEELPPRLEAQHTLLEAIHAWAGKHGNEFIRDWFSFNRDLQNILMAINARKHGLPFAKYLVGTGWTVEQLATSHAADFGLGKESEIYNAAYRVWEQNNLLYRERGYDILRWKWIDNQNFFHVFNIDRILGYYCQLRILNRWIKMDPEAGAEVFQDTLNSLENSLSFPAQFNVKSISKK